MLTFYGNRYCLQVPQFNDELFNIYNNFALFTHFTEYSYRMYKILSFIETNGLIRSHNVEKLR